MDYRNQKRFFEKAFSLGDKRIEAGYGWANEVDDQVIKFLKLIKKHVPTGTSLDIGCGQGRHALFFAEQGFNSYGIDYIPRALKEARQEAKQRNLKNTHFL